MLLIHTVLYELTVNLDMHTASSERLEAGDQTHRAGQLRRL